MPIQPEMPDEGSIEGELIEAGDLEAGPSIAGLCQELMIGFGMSEDELTFRLWQELKADLPRQEVAMDAALLKIARHEGHEPRRFIDGLGQNVARIPKEVYAYWVSRLGPYAWDDGDLLKFLVKRNPALLRKSQGKTMITVGTPLRGGRSSPGRLGEASLPHKEAA
jgi:hypothetical protein